MSDVLATSHIPLFTKFKLLKIKCNLKFRFLVTSVTLQVLSNHVWLVAAILDGTNVEEHFRHRRKVYWMAYVLDSLINSPTHIKVRGSDFQKAQALAHIRLRWAS